MCRRRSGAYHAALPCFELNTLGITGLCLEVHDLAIAKYVAGREKDREFTHELAKQKMVRRNILMDRERDTDLSPEVRKLVRARIARDFKASPT